MVCQGALGDHHQPLQRVYALQAPQKTQKKTLEAAQPGPAVLLIQTGMAEGITHGPGEKCGRTLMDQKGVKSTTGDG